MRILVLNPGSATLKATVLAPPDPRPSFEHTIEWVGADAAATADDAVGTILAALRERDPASAATVAPVDAVGYRVVHGGDRFVEATVLDDAAVDAIEGLRELAPLHNPAAAATIRATRRALPGAFHVAAFDTAFHATLPAAIRRYPVPDDWAAAPGAHRSGFHGLSVAWSTSRAADLLGRPVAGLAIVVAHLGGGCSVTAVDGGRSVDTSMGMTPLEGLMMGTRAGSIDPGLILRRVREGHPADEVETDLDTRSGLVGVAGTADMAVLLTRATTGEPRASLAIDMFVWRAAAAIAATATHLPRLDALVFTGGIGEHATQIRARICDRLGVLGIAPLPRWMDTDVDGDEDHGHDAIVSGPDGPAVLRVRAREDIVIAQAVSGILPTPTP